jgi:ArsR family transcriptional regulator, arsenate/arsenite/antimonite-responsive transcriptional repressor
MEATAVTNALAALAQETRLAVFRLLVQAGPEGLAAGRIGAALGQPAATLSFHLGQLRQAGLVSYRRQGRSLIYVAEFAAMAGVIAYLTEKCCGGDAAACGLPAAVAAREGAEA